MKKFAILIMLTATVLLSGKVKLNAAVETDPSTVRSILSIYNIDDGGRFTNPMDVVNFQATTGKTISQWKALGYNDVKIYITVNMREVDDGYQYIFVYRNDYSTATGNYLFYEEQIEWGPGFRNTLWGDYQFSTITIDLDDFVNGQFIVRYGASGNQNDDWQNRNLRIYFIFD